MDFPLCYGDGGDVEEAAEEAMDEGDMTSIVKSMLFYRFVSIPLVVHRSTIGMSDSRTCGRPMGNHLLSWFASPVEDQFAGLE